MQKPAPVVSVMVSFMVFNPALANVLTGFLAVEVVESLKLQSNNSPFGKPIEFIEVLLNETVKPLIVLLKLALQTVGETKLNESDLEEVQFVTLS